MAVSKDGPGVEEIPEGDQKGEVAPNRPPDAGEPAIPAPGLEGQPPSRLPTPGVSNQKAGHGACSQGSPEPRKGCPAPGEEAPDDGREGQTREVGQRCANEHVEKQGKKAGPAHIVGGIVSRET
jgi:hypothetical protein